MSLLDQPSESEIKRYNHWVNFDVLPKLVLAYNENLLSLYEFKSMAHFSDGSQLYDELKDQVSFNVISTKDQPDFVFIMVTTPSNEDICEVALACIAVNKILHDAFLMTMEYTFGSTYVICEPTTSGHNNFSIYIDDNEQFIVSARDLAMKRWHEMSLPKTSKTARENDSDEDNTSKASGNTFSYSISLNSIQDVRKALVELMDNLNQEAGAKMSPPIDIKKKEIKQSWPLLDFYHIHGKMSVISGVSKKDGTKYKSCKFRDDNYKIVYVSFSKALGELTPREIAVRKKELMVVLTKFNEFVLCSKEEIE
ncbi:MAG: hypothetical protein SPL96_05395 [Bacteroidales bacterium]|nr:hypothetical protein [Bacteroidales bacterium]